jgi:predicted RNase H-like HicB family nuclease
LDVRTWYYQDVRYTVILSPDPAAGCVTALCPAMPGAIAEGDTRDAALAELAGVMDAWVELSAERGGRPLEETPELVARAIASVLEDRDESGLDRALETTMLEPAGLALV